MTYSREIPVLMFGELGLIHCLGSAGIPVFTASEKEPNISACSRYSKRHIVFPAYDSAQFIDELCKFGTTCEGRIILMCHDDRAMLNISENRERLEKNFLFCLPKKETVRKLLDKLLFARLCQEYDLPAPQSVEIEKFEELRRVKEKMKAPYIIKPAYRHYWYHSDFQEVVGNYQKAFVCQTFEELETLYKKIFQIHPDVVIQEYITGEDHRLYDVNLHVNGEGSIDGYVISQKLRVYPPRAGWGSYVKTVMDDEMFELCADIISKLDLKGMVNIQFKKDERTDRPKLIEIHTRTSIFDFLGARAGQNIPLKYYSSLTGRSCETAGYKPDVKYINLSRDLRLLLRYRKFCNLSLSDWIKTYNNVSVYDGMMLKDPKVFYYELKSAFINR